jgi:hypothetical protein
MEPDLERMPLDPHRPALEQLEEQVLNAPNREEFDRRLEWLKAHYYQNPDKLSAMVSTPFSMNTKDSPQT